MTGEPDCVYVNTAIIGVGREGCAAFKHYKSIPQNSCYVNKLYFCEQPCLNVNRDTVRVIQECPVLFWLLDMRDIAILKSLYPYLKIHKMAYGKRSLSVCITYSSQMDSVSLELADDMDLMVFVVNPLDSLSAVVEMLLNDLIKFGLIGIDLDDVFSVLRMCRTMHYFRRSGKNLAELNRTVEALKKDVENTFGSAEKDVPQNGIVCLKTDYTCGIEAIEPIAEAFENDGYWVNQITFHSDETKKTLDVSLLVGK